MRGSITASPALDFINSKRRGYLDLAKIFAETSSVLPWYSTFYVLSMNVSYCKRRKLFSFSPGSIYKRSRQQACRHCLFETFLGSIFVQGFLMTTARHEYANTILEMLEHSSLK